MNGRELLEKELRASCVTHQTCLSEVLTAHEAACIEKKALFNNLSTRKVQQEMLLSKVLSAETMLHQLKEDPAHADNSM